MHNKKRVCASTKEGRTREDMDKRKNKRKGKGKVKHST